jgi:transcriptional regulator with XRE-family HTH domain
MTLGVKKFPKGGNLTAAVCIQYCIRFIEGVIPVVQSIGANIKAKRRSLGLNQGDLAAALGLTQANVSRIESSVKGPNGEMLLSIAGALGCDVRELLGVEEDGQPVQQLDDDAKTFVLNAMKGDPQFGIYLRSFAKDSEDLTDEDWKFLATQLKLALGYASDAIKARRMKGNF